MGTDAKIANPSPSYRGREKRGFRSQKTPISPPPQKRASRVKKSPFLHRAPQGKWDFFDSRRPFLGWGERGVFLTPKPSFLDFGVFDPCKGQTDSQCKSQSLAFFFVFGFSAVLIFGKFYAYSPWKSLLIMFLGTGCNCDSLLGFLTHVRKPREGAVSSGLPFKTLGL